MGEQCREIQQWNCTGSDACADFSVLEQCSSVWVFPLSLSLSLPDLSAPPWHLKQRETLACCFLDRHPPPTTPSTPGETGTYQHWEVFFLRCLLRVGWTKVHIVKIFFFLPSCHDNWPLFSASPLRSGGGTSLLKVSSISSSLSEAASSVTGAVLRARLSQRHLASLHTSCLNVERKALQRERKREQVAQG